MLSKVRTMASRSIDDDIEQVGPTVHGQVFFLKAHTVVGDRKDRFLCFIRPERAGDKSIIPR